MIHIATPKHANLKIGVQQNEVGSDFQRQECRVILGIQIGSVVEIDVSRVAPCFDLNGSQVEASLALERLEKLERLRPRQQQTFDQMIPQDGIAQDLGEEKPLADFETVLVFLKTFAFFNQVSRCGQQARQTACCQGGQLLDPHRGRAVVGQFTVDLADMIAEKLPCGIRHQMDNCVAGQQFNLGAVGLQWKG